MRIVLIIKMKKGLIVEIKDEILEEIKGKKIKKIFHMADLHIQRNNNRHLEYKKVFDTLFSTLKKDIGKKSNESIICIVGDILHDGFAMAPDQFDLIKYFFHMLTKLAPVFIVPGNHDYHNVDQRKNLLDPLTSFFGYFSTGGYNLYIAAENKCYIYNNIIFGLTMFSAQSVTRCNYEKNDKHKVGLYHGQFYKCQLNDKNILSDKGFTCESFSDYDIVCCGDIHLFSYLNSSKTIAYCSSLIQQNITENQFDHGYLVWDLENDYKSTFVRIPNEQMFVDIEVTSDLSLIKQMIECGNYKGKTINLTLKSDQNVSDDTIKKAQNLLEENGTKIGNFNHIPKNKFQDISGIIKIGDKEFDIFKCNNREKIRDLFMARANEVYKNVPEDEAKLLEKYLDYALDETYKKCEINNNGSSKCIELVYVKFNNALTYGLGNSVNFMKLLGKIGLCGKNGIGKSSLCFVIEFALTGYFDEKLYNDIAARRKNQTFIQTEICFKMNGDTYIIVRDSRRRNNDNKTKMTDKDSDGGNYRCVLYKNGKLEQSAEGRLNVTNMNRDIAQKICSIEYFKKHAIISQENADNFLKMSNKNERFDVLLDILGLNFFRKLMIALNDICKDRNKETKKFRLNANGVKKKDVEIKNDLELLEKELKESDEKINCIKANLDMKNNEILNKNTEINKLNYFLENNNSCSNIDNEIDYLNNKIDKLSKNLKICEHDLKHICNNINVCKKKKKILILDIEKYKALNIDDEYFKNKKYILELNRENDLKILNNKLVDMYNLLSINNHYLDEKIDCEKVFESINVLYSELNIMKNKLIIIKDEHMVRENYKNYENLCDIINKLNNKKIIIENELLDLEKQYGKIKDHKYNENCDACMQNPITYQYKQFLQYINDKKNESKKLDIELQQNNTKMNKIKKSKNIYDNMCQNISSNIVINKQITDLNNKINDIKNMMSLQKKQKKIRNNILFINSNITLFKTEIENTDIYLDSDVEKYELNRKMYDVILLKFEKNNFELEKLIMEEKILNSTYINLSNDLTNCQKELDKLNNNKEINKKLYLYEIELKHAIICLDEMKNDYADIHTKYDVALKMSSELFNKIDNKKIYLNKINENKKHKIVCKRILDMIESKYMKKENDNCYDNNIVENENDDGEDKDEHTKKCVENKKSKIIKNSLIDTILDDHILPKIENSVNELFSNINCSFKIKFKCVAEYVDVFMAKDENVLRTDNLYWTDATHASGGEKNILNLALRWIIHKFNVGTKFNFLFLDECMRDVDIENKDVAIRLLNEISSSYKYMVIITHNDNIKTEMNGFLYIKNSIINKNSISYINNDLNLSESIIDIQGEIKLDLNNKNKDIIDNI